MEKIRVLIVDDAVVVRRMLSDALTSDPELEVISSAANGRIALSKIYQLNPDIVILDVEMPEMDGLQALAEIRKTHARLPVIMFSTHTERGAAATFDALQLGASDYLTKPSNVGSMPQAMQSIREQLIPKIKAFCRKSTRGSTSTTPVRSPKAGERQFIGVTSGSRSTATASSKKVDILAIGVSTGGPNALEAVLSKFPADFPVPIVVVQHMPSIFTKLLADRLNVVSTIHVSEAVPGEALQPGRAYVAPGGFHMFLERDGSTVRVRTNVEPPEHSCRPAVDVLFRSVAQLYGASTLAIILTGMGQDGLLGCERIRAAGGLILVQDEASSVVWGMPGAVAKANLADEVLPLDQLPAAIMRRAREFQTAPVAAR